jgi:predicted phosphodiesterase
LPVQTTLGTEAKTLGMLRSERRNDVERYRKAALGHLDGMSNPGRVVTLGHTHQPDYKKDGDDQYFNTGSWTRFVPYAKSPKLTLEALRREEDFPYELNALYVRPKPDRTLTAEMECFDRR